ncbi:MAG: helix-turn-helix transcriptional regulator [Candidatus Lokiarchaeota archaeon]|nr:helix-turn-helix transcriptional regulator [Candidatus Lokiarchaeota archaeon]
MNTITIKNKQLSEKELSQIFNVVKHPLRRGILKLLSNGPQSYTMILKNLEIPESSILNYHLREIRNIFHNIYLLDNNNRINNW